MLATRKKIDSVVTTALLCAPVLTLIDDHIIVLVSISGSGSGYELTLADSLDNISTALMLIVKF